MAKARASGEGSIRQRKDGRWEVRITIGIDFNTGEPKRISRYTKTQEEAVRLLHQLQVAYSQGLDLADRTTVKEWLELWLTVYMRNTLKQSTYASYETYIRHHFVPAFGNMPLQDLTPRLLQQFYNHKSEVEKLSPKTITNLNLCLHKALSHAVQEGLIPSNPASSLNLPSGQKPNIEILTIPEQNALVRASYEHRYGVFVRLVLFTGLRMGELLGLRWEDIDFYSGMLYVRRTLNRLQKTNLPDHYTGPRTEIVIQEPKTSHSVRSIPLLPFLLSELQQWRQVQETDRQLAKDQYTESGMLVTNPLGGYIEPRTFKDYYNSILKLSGIGHRTFHALRHTFASRAMERGMDAKTLSTLLGHASVSFTMDTYTHVLDDHKRDGMKLMESLYTDCIAPQHHTYPVQILQNEDGYLLTAPDFPGVSCTADTLEEGLHNIQDALQEAVLTVPSLPPVSNTATMPMEPGTMVLQITVS